MIEDRDVAGADRSLSLARSRQAAEGDEQRADQQTRGGCDPVAPASFPVSSLAGFAH